MRILYALNSGNPGGMEYHVLDLVRGMIKKGHIVHVWCRSGPIADWYTEAGALVTTKELVKDIDVSYIKELKKYLTEAAIEVVHAHELKPVTNALIAAFLARTPVKISHTHTPISEWKINKLLKAVNILVNTLAVNLFSSAEIALTESRKKVKKAEGIKEKKLVVIPNGIDIAAVNTSVHKQISFRADILNKYNIAENVFIIGNVSRMTEEKGHSTLIEAFKLFIDRPQTVSTSFHLLLAGGGLLEESYRQLVNRLGLAGKVTITGVFDSEDLMKFYTTFDMFVFPTLAEGFGNVLLEAMAARLPIVCSNLPVLNEVAGETVLYAQPGDARDFEDKIYYLYSKKDSLANLKEEAYHRVQELYSLTKFISSYENLYLLQLGKK